MINIQNNHLVSVIIPTYNGGGGAKLKNAIESIINQTIGFENIELIIVDDASDDKITPKIILKYQYQYPNNIKYIKLKENSGYPGKPRNIGMDNATTDYIIFLDHDDHYLPHAIEWLYNTIEKHNSDLIIANHYNNINGYKIKGMKKFNQTLINTNPLKNQENFNILSMIIGFPWAKIYKKESLIKNNIKFKEKIIQEDTHFYFQILKHCKKISLFPNEIIYSYNIYNESTIHTHNTKLINAYIKGTYNICEIIKEINLNANLSLTENISSLLLIYSNLDKQYKKQSALKIYNLEKYMENELKFKMNNKRKELKILNNAIMQKKFKKAFYISQIYKKLYNNNLIQKIYKKFRGAS